MAAMGKMAMAVVALVIVAGVVVGVSDVNRYLRIRRM
jgi:hypothetical protein